MSHELHYTSASRGLKPGTHGFCTVAATAHLAAPVAERLEGLSGYRPAFPPGHPSARLNPAVVSHLKLNLIGRSFHILSRVGEAGLDYSGRGNKYAHHVALEGPERPAGGPAWLAGRRGFLDESWSGEPRVLPKGRPAPPGDQPPALCRAWARRFGDAGWAGVVADLFLTEPNRPVYFFFDPGEDLLPLFAEAIALLPVERRWDVSFSTYYTGQAQGLTCLWRGVVRDSPEAEQARRLPGVLVLDPLNLPGTAPSGTLVEQARTGIFPNRPSEPAPSPAAAPPAGAARANPADSPKDARQPLEEAYLLDYAPSPRPRVERARLPRSGEGVDKAQVATWVGVVASLVFLIGASAAWYRSRAMPAANQAALGGPDKASDLEARSVEGDPQPVGSAAIETNQSPVARPRNSPSARQNRAEPNRPPVATDSPTMMPSPIEKGTKPPEVADPDNLTRKADAIEPPPTVPVASTPPNPDAIVVLRPWDIQNSRTLLINNGRLPKAIELWPIPTEKNQEPLEFKQENEKRISIRYQENGSSTDLATISCSSEGVIELKKSDSASPDSEKNEKKTLSFGLIGNSILKVSFEGGEPDEYYLLQKRLKVSRSIVLREHLSSNMKRVELAPIVLKDQMGVDLPKIEFGECQLRPTHGEPAIPFGRDAQRPSVVLPRQGSEQKRELTLSIYPEAFYKRGELSFQFSEWNVDTWALIKNLWSIQPPRMEVEVLEQFLRQARDMIAEQQSYCDKRRIEHKRLTSVRQYSAADKLSRELKKEENLLRNLEVIERRLSIIDGYRIDLTLLVTPEGAGGRRFQVPLEDEEDDSRPSK